MNDTPTSRSANPSGMPSASGQRLEILHGAALAPHAQALAQLRIAVFREWPYLYEGSLDYEQHYLATYIDCPRSVTALVWDGAQCVGACTALPMRDASDETREPFEAADYPLPRICYFGESLLLRPWRGLGWGKRFFEVREAHAQALGLDLCAFCSVDRPPQHPLKPADYVPNDAFWTRRGYQKQPGLQASFSWLDIGETQATSKPLTFWMRTLPPAGAA